MFQTPHPQITPGEEVEGIIPVEKEETAVQIAKKEEINGIIPGKGRDATQR